jgi:hypothetical protein
MVLFYLTRNNISELLSILTTNAEETQIKAYLEQHINRYTRQFHQNDYLAWKHLRDYDKEFWNQVKHEIQDIYQFPYECIKWVLKLPDPKKSALTSFEMLLYWSLKFLANTANINIDTLRVWQVCAIQSAVSLLPQPKEEMPFNQIIDSAKDLIHTHLLAGMVVPTPIKKKILTVRVKRGSTKSPEFIQKKFLPWWKHVSILQNNVFFYDNNMIDSSFGRSQFKFSILKNNKKWLKKRMFTLYNIFLSHLNHRQDKIWGIFFSSRKYTTLINIRSRFLYTLQHFFKKLSKKHIYASQNLLNTDIYYKQNILKLEILPLLVLLRSQLIMKIAQAIHFFRYGYISINGYINKRFILPLSLHDEVSLHADLILDFKTYNWFYLRQNLYTQTKVLVPHWLEVNKITNSTIIWVFPSNLDFKNYQLSLWDLTIFSKFQFNRSS